MCRYEYYACQCIQLIIQRSRVEEACLIAIWRLELTLQTQSRLWVLANSIWSNPDTKKLQEVTFFVARNDGSVLLSCTTTLVLGLIQPRTRLDYLPPRARLITSSVDHQQKTRCQVAVHSSTTDSTVPLWKNVVPKQEVPKLVTSKEQILSYYPDVFEGIGRFPRSPIPYTA